MPYGKKKSGSKKKSGANFTANERAMQKRMMGKSKSLLKKAGKKKAGYGANLTKNEEATLKRLMGKKRKK